jgi:leucyl-tRNA synthetase
MPGWPERVKTMQANWIGKSVGVRFAFTHDIARRDGKLVGDGRMYVFTTRADTDHGRHVLRGRARASAGRGARAQDPTIAAFVDECKRGR